MRHSQPVVVVGAGIAGLAVAQRAAALGRDVVVLERSDRVGGQIHQTTLAGHQVDVGAESFAVRGGAGAALLADLGLSDALTLPNPAPAWVHGTAKHPYPLPATGVLGIPSDPLAADVRRALGPLGALRAAADRLLPTSPLSDDATLGSVVTRRMGARVTRRLVDPVVRGVYSAHADDLPLRVASSPLADALAAGGRLAPAAAAVRAAAPAGSAVAGVTGGLGRLVAALVADLGSRGADIRLRSTVTDVAADHVVVDGERLDGTVVVAAPGLAGEVLTTRTITVVAAAVRSRDLDAAPRGTGVLVAPGSPGVTARALTHSSAKWPWLTARDGVHVLRLSYDAPPVARRPDDSDDDEARAALMAIVVADLAALTGARDLEVLDVAQHTWTRTLAVRPIPDAPVAVGEASGRTGLAAILTHARGDAVGHALATVEARKAAS